MKGHLTTKYLPSIGGWALLLEGIILRVKATRRQILKCAKGVTL